jgi:hypothetical protein
LRKLSTQCPSRTSASVFCSQQSAQCCCRFCSSTRETLLGAVSSITAC